MNLFVKFLALTLLFYPLLLSFFPYGIWHLIQIYQSIFGHASFFATFIKNYESKIWADWERDSNENKELLEPLIIPTITSLDDLSSLNLNRPFLIKNLSNIEMLTISKLLTPPISQLPIDYFHDARIINTVPNSFDQVGTILQKILQGGPEKIGTQMIVKNFPEIIEQFVDKNPWLSSVFGENRVKQWRDISPLMTFPIFISRGRHTTSTSSSTSTPIETTTTRTDLHCEPISNVVIQTVGKKKWTLVESQYSHLIRPTVSPDGRAYFYSSLNPFDSYALDHIPHYEFIAEEGDLLYVPTWTWHRVDYSPNITAVSLSIFQFIPGDYLRRNPVFALTLIPNLLKEAIGIKEQ